MNTKNVKSVSFTLLELFLSIGSIIIIALMIIPFINRVFTITEKKVFVEFADLVYKNTVDDYINKDTDPNTCYVYDLKKDLNLDDLGSFEGYSIVKDNIVYLSIHNKDFAVSNIEYINKSFTDKYLEKFNNNNNFNVSDLLTLNECQNSEYISK